MPSRVPERGFRSATEHEGSQGLTCEDYRGRRCLSIEDVLDLGDYLTTAVKCGKTDYRVKAPTVKACSHLLEAEISLFPNVRIVMLMGDAAIKALNHVGRRSGEERVIPAGSTDKIRGQEYAWCGRQVLPSYLQAGPSFSIEKSRRRMIAEDIANALALLG